jgi:hypothetical protein
MSDEVRRQVSDVLPLRGPTDEDHMNQNAPPPGPEVLARLELLARLERVVRTALAQTAGDARLAGFSWRTIGRASGYASGANAYQRWHKAADETVREQFDTPDG